MSVLVRAHDGVTVVEVAGDLDCSSASTLREAVAAVDDACAVVVDLGGVPFLDSAGLGALIGGIRTVRERGGSVAVHAPRPAVLRLLRMTGVDRVVPICDSCDDALAALGANIDALLTA